LDLDTDTDTHAHLRDKYAIVGVGETAYVRGAGKTTRQLAQQAVGNAIADSGLDRRAIDGMLSYSYSDSTASNLVGADLGLRLNFFMDCFGGGSSTEALVGLAIGAMEAGMCEAVVVFRSMNGYSGLRMGGTGAMSAAPVADEFLHTRPYGWRSAAQMFSPTFLRHMHDYGTRSEQVAAVKVAHSRHASNNPKALYKQRMTVDDVLASRMICTPLHLLDCCIESDGGCAVIVTTAERARSLRKPPAWIMGAAQGSGTRARGIIFRDDLATTEAHFTAKDVYASAGVGPADIDAVMIYDHFTPFIPMALEAYGFCGRGEGGPFVEDGRIHFDGELPVNTHGGNHSEAYIHGLPHIIEATRQLRGESSAQVPGCEVVLSCSAVAQLSAAVILRKD